MFKNQFINRVFFYYIKAQYNVMKMLILEKLGKSRGLNIGVFIGGVPSGAGIITECSRGFYPHGNLFVALTVFYRSAMHDKGLTALCLTSEHIERHGIEIILTTD